jgi:hypothetical protein
MDNTKNKIFILIYHRRKPLELKFNTLILGVKAVMVVFTSTKFHAIIRELFLYRILQCRRLQSSKLAIL